MDQFDREIEQATKRAEQRLAHDPRAVAAHYDANGEALIITLSTGYSVSFPRARLQGLSGAALGDLTEIVISPSGYGLRFPRLDADLWLPGLLEGVFGSRAWMAAQLGAQGGRATSEAKAAAARANGQRGGRPVKHVTAKAAARKRAKVAAGPKATVAKKKRSKSAERFVTLRTRRKAAAKRKPTKRTA